MTTVQRPRPPEGDDALVEILEGNRVIPAPEVADWAVETFIGPDAPLENEDHHHLRWASFGVVWTNIRYDRKGRRVVGMAEEPQIRAHGWAKARHDQQMRDWFGQVPDFLLTFYAPYCAELSDASWCALVEHELYHCAQDTTASGQPAFTRQGTPKYTIIGHDVEEFVGVVRRYGADAAGRGVQRLVEVAGEEPEVTAAEIADGCGVCLKRAA